MKLSRLINAPQINIDFSRVKTISWETYSESGALKSVSKSHIIDPDNTSYSLCGTYVADKPAGYDNDVCTRCANKYSKEAS